MVAETLEDIYTETRMPGSAKRHRPIHQTGEAPVPMYRRASRRRQDDELLDELATGTTGRASREQYQQRRNLRPVPDAYDEEQYEQLEPHTRMAHPYRQPQREVQHKQPAKGSKLWIAWLLVGALAAWLLLQLGLFLWNWGTDVSNDLHYGPTRTSVVSGVFGHNNDSKAQPTSVIAMNLNGKLLLEEIPAGDMSKMKAYPTSFTLIGSDAAKWPAALTISQGNDGHLPNVMVQISGQNITFMLVNNGPDFTVSQQGG